ncbi:flavin reductase family protein [Egbenema bharatensis]|uniref:flavin reductase family protein n=1 Tax=Egbenema bharatensis TaxID=3463334 RepID=UPI003A835B27
MSATLSSTISEPSMLSFVPEEMTDPAPYHLLTSVVAPRPIAWVSTISSSGIPNLAPYSFFNAVAGFPPTLMFSVAYRRKEPREKDTLRNIKEVDEFVCHVVDESLSEAMIQTAIEFPYEVNEFETANLAMVPALDVRPFRIAAATVAMECKVTQIVPVEGATNVMVLGRVLRFHVREDLYRPELGLVDTVQMKPITRLGGPIEYTKIGELFPLPMPAV